MAIVTKYSLSAYGNLSKTIDEFKSEIEEFSGYGELTFSKEVKWYEHETQLIEFSKMYPDTVFELICNSGSIENTCKKVFENGSVEIINAHIVFGDAPIETPIVGTVFEASTDSQMKWWCGLNEDTQNAITHSLFYHKIFDLGIAFKTFSNLIY